MPVDGRLDYRSYSVVELREAESTIDREMFPKNFAALQTELKARGKLERQAIVIDGLHGGTYASDTRKPAPAISAYMEWRASVLKSIALALCGALMAVGSYYMTRRPELQDVVIGWMGTILFGLSTLVIGRQVLRRGPVVVIDRTGVFDSRNGAGVIPWAEIVSVSIRQNRSTRWLALHLSDEQSYLSRLTFWKRLVALASRTLGTSPCSLSFVGLSPGVDAAYERIVAGIEKRFGA